MSNPEIAIHKIIVMSLESVDQHIKRTQKDYTLSFKVQVIQEIESGSIGIKAAQHKYGIQGDATIRTWLRKHGNLDWVNKNTTPMKITPEQKLLEYEQENLLLKKQLASVKKELEFTDKKSIFFDMMIDIAEEEFNIPIRKKCSPEQLINIKQNNKKP